MTGADAADLARRARPVARAVLSTIWSGLPREGRAALVGFFERVLGAFLALHVGMTLVALFFGDYVGPITVAVYLGVRVVALFPGRWRDSREPKRDEPREPMGYRHQAERAERAGEERAPDPAQIGQALVIAAPMLLLYLACWAGTDGEWVEGLLASIPSSAIGLVWAGWGLVVLGLRRLRKRLEAARG